MAGVEAQFSRLNQARKENKGVSVKQVALSKQVIDRLAKRWAQTIRLRVDCKLGREPPRRRGGGCSKCRPPQEFELDQEVAQLISSGVFKGTGKCPYRVITSHLIAGLIAGPEVFRARSMGQYHVDPVMEIKGALKRIRIITRATRLTREDIGSFEDKDDWSKALYLVSSAEQALENALPIFGSRMPVKTGRSRRAGALHIQAAARALVGAWYVLTRRLPAKNNSKFRALLRAANFTLFGHSGKEPNFESATRIAVRHFKKSAATEGS
jgi:hypothetical protein